MDLDPLFDCDVEPDDAIQFRPVWVQGHFCTPPMVGQDADLGQSVLRKAGFENSDAVLACLRRLGVLPPFAFPV